MVTTPEGGCTVDASCSPDDHTYTWPCDHAPGTGRLAGGEPVVTQPSWGGQVVTGIEVLVCTRCSFSQPVDLPVAGGRALDPQASATVYVDEDDTTKLMVVPHRPGCIQLGRRR